MVKLKLRRPQIARVLLAVILPMLLLSWVHIHPYQPVADSDCEECIAHRHHDGHFRTAQLCMHDCVVCQMLSLVFVAAAAVVLITSPRVLTTLCRCNPPLTVIQARGLHQLRAPPFLP